MIMTLATIKGRPIAPLPHYASFSLPIMSEQPLPYGWVQEFDPNTSHPFWVCYTSLPSHRYSDH